MLGSDFVRASSADMMELACDVGPAPRHLGAVILLAAGTALDPHAVRAEVAARMGTIRRLRQRLVYPPRGCGRPYWIDERAFNAADHVRAVRCPPPGDRTAVLAAATDALTRPLRPDRPLWEVTMMTGLAGGRMALVVVVHHVLADGMGGLAVLARLVDDGPAQSSTGSRTKTPSTAELAVDALFSRLRALGRIRAVPATVRAALVELRSGSTARPARCSLNRPVGTRRQLVTVSSDLAQIAAVARSHTASVNDVMLTVVGRTLDTVLARRGEHVDAVVISVPISARSLPAAATLGNQVGVMPVAVPTAGARADACLAAVANATRERKTLARGSSIALLAPAFRALRAMHLLRWAVNHQHLVHTVMTNLKGPDAPVRFLGTAVREIVPLNLLAGNIAMTFTIFSYAGTITITVVVDPDAVPDADVLADALRTQLDEVRQLDGDPESAGDAGQR
jgi:WS/DGAT/MGAT family acyltransferase